MISLVIPVVFLWATCKAEDYYYNPLNATRTTLSGIAAYRSALTLDWLAAEDMRQRELASAFETEAAPPFKSISTDCIGYARPASGKVARLMLELLKNLEGDDGTIVSELIVALVRSKLLVETSMLESEPDLESLVKTPGVMMGEPHTTFPRILAIAWMAVTDPVTTKKFGWCPITRVNKYLAVSRPVAIAKQMRAIEPVIARARFIMEEFIQHVTPLNMYQRKMQPESATQQPKVRKLSSVEKSEPKTKSTRPMRSLNTVRPVHLALAQATTPVLMESEAQPLPRSDESSAGTRSTLCNLPHFLIATFVLVS